MQNPETGLDCRILRKPLDRELRLDRSGCPNVRTPGKIRAVAPTLLPYHAVSLVGGARLRRLADVPTARPFDQFAMIYVRQLRATSEHHTEDFLGGPNEE